jgi:hypothetical protein
VGSIRERERERELEHVALSDREDTIKWALSSNG